MINDPLRRRDPGTACDSTRARNKATTCNSTLFREFVSIIVVGILMAVVMVDSVVGMSSGFSPTSEVVLMAAGVGADGR